MQRAEQLGGACRGHHDVTFAAEEVVAEALSKPRERVAHGGLRDMEKLGSGRQAAQLVEHDEGAQLVQIRDSHALTPSMENDSGIYWTI